MIMINKRTISLALVLLMIVAVLAGCTGTPTTPSQTTSTTQPTTTETTQPLPEPGNPKLPLTDTPVTLKGYYPMTAESLQVLTSWNDNEGQKELAKRTGVTIEWQNPVIGQDSEAFTIMINSGTLPDIIVYPFTAYPGGYTAALNDGLILDVKDLVDQYAPNYRVLREEYDDFRKGSMTDDGKLPGFFTCMKSTISQPWGGFMIRKDWLTDLGLPMPVTFDDWYTTLKAFKEEKGATIPLIMQKNGLYFGDDFISGFDIVATSGFYQIDGAVKYGPIQPAFKEYLTLVNKWYEEGLIGEDFMTDQSMFYAPNPQNIGTGKSGIFWAAYPLLDMYKALGIPNDPDFELAPILSPVKKAGDKLHFSAIGGFGIGAGFGVAIASSTKYPELAAKWCDYQYSPDGYLLSNFGLEGVSYEMVDNKPKFLKSVLEDKNGITKNVYRYGSTIYDRDIEYYQIATDAQRVFMDVWGKAGTDYHIVAALTPTTEETEKYTALMTDINTTVSEAVLKFIIGDRPLEEFDDFVTTLKTMGIEEAITIYQAQYDRYNKR